MYTLKLKSEEMLAESQQELDETRNRIHQDIEAQRAEIMHVDEAIESASRQLQVLKHYKDKEHPLRQVKIEQLKETQEEVRTSQAEDREELELQIVEEKEHYEHHLRAMRAELQTRATEV